MNFTFLVVVLLTALAFVGVVVALFACYFSPFIQSAKV